MCTLGDAGLLWHLYSLLSESQAHATSCAHTLTSVKQKKLAPFPLTHMQSRTFNNHSTHARWCIRHFSLRGWNRSPTVAFLVFFFLLFFAVEQNEEYFWTTVTAVRLKKKRKSRRERSLRSVKDAWLFVRGWLFVCLYAIVCASLSSSGLCASGATKSVPD